MRAPRTTAARRPRSVTLVTVGIAAAGLGAALTACGSGSQTSSPATSAPQATSTASAAPSAAPGKPARLCGTARGPEGPLDVNVLQGSKPVECTEVMPIATAFGPKIASAKPATIDGWKCGMGKVPGMLGTCTKDGREFGLFIKQ
ncbi:hypothetical protein P0W64_13070 [Tsukamurella sp. 8F]|uniref:hypothetical protein n=1 Tax=unclassified Tsukamurella TaxID=2633480 RepID=UPI0023B954FC|nr:MULTISPECIES: hypothetical protein [unclassified Tsukamurella]MDF0530473.1 hypothetical protein [Tsukamurella sp. 8J]MDF0587706.1 hypothetical protein [Tsukamurella sp. 8F]